MSFQITVLKVLAGHPGGRASLADLKRYVAVLACSGADWSQRMKRLAARAPGLDVFSSAYVLRDAKGWEITNAGRAFLASIEALTPLEAEKSPAAVVPPSSVALSNVIDLADHQHMRRPRAA